MQTKTLNTFQQQQKRNILNKTHRLDTDFNMSIEMKSFIRLSKSIYEYFNESEADLWKKTSQNKINNLYIHM